MIGLFDSGSGGLSVLQALRKRVPEIDVVYYGDIKHAPYGERSQDDLLNLTIGGIRTLRMFGAQEIVSACNTVAPSVLSHGAEGARLIEMTRPAARAMRRHAGGRVLLLATPATVHSKIYQHLLDVIVVLDQLPIPRLAGAIEFGAPGEEVRNIVRKAFAERWGQTYDHIFLGCTHFPFARTIIEEEARTAFGDVEIIDPADAVAEEVERMFDLRGARATYFKLSQDSEHFRRRARELFGATDEHIKVIPGLGPEGY
ncbi:MAG TPA: aspartate/glutamate racemase family protein [Candidatus Paceibacterota bacterium]|nr:aspartate/glutamate racemase family protein [Candidatus Paceibacterota bacterium]